jgi:hypothetical protein
MTGWHGFPRKNAHRPNGAVFFSFFGHTHAARSGVESHLCHAWARRECGPHRGRAGSRPASDSAARVARAAATGAGPSGQWAPRAPAPTQRGERAPRPATPDGGSRQEPARAPTASASAPRKRATATALTRPRARHAAALAARAPRPRRTRAPAPRVLRKQARRLGPDTKPDPGAPPGDGAQPVPRRPPLQPRCCQCLPGGRPLRRPLCQRPNFPLGSRRRWARLADPEERGVLGGGCGLSRPGKDKPPARRSECSGHDTKASTQHYPACSEFFSS